MTGDSTRRKEIEDNGLSFKLILKEDQSNYYQILDNDALKEYATSGELIIPFDGESYNELELTLNDSVVHTSRSDIDQLCPNDKAFLDDLVAKKLIKRKTISYEEMAIPVDELYSMEK